MLDAKALGSNIQKYRLLRGLTQESAAEECGLTTNYFRQIELGFKVPRLETFLRIADVLNVSTDLLFAGKTRDLVEIRSSELYSKIEKLPKAQQEYILDTVGTLISGIKSKRFIFTRIANPQLL